MANTIKLKRASGSDPGASDLVVGEVALRTDTAKLFTKKDDNSVAEIGGSATVADGAITTAKIADDAVTYAKIQNVSATDRLLGRDSSGAGIVEEIAPSAVRTMLGLATSATTDTTNASNIGSGTLAAARVATLNQDTTGSAATLTTARNIGGVSFDGSANINLPGVNTSGNQNTSGNAATATALANARTIAGVSFDGTGNISLNNNAITNGAGYITSADGGNAATLDGIDSSSFVRSDADDGITGQIGFENTGAYPIVIGASSGANDAHLLLRGSSNPYIQFREGNSDKAFIQWHSGGYFWFYNQESAEYLKIGSGTNGLIFSEGGSERTVYHTGNLSVGDGGLTSNNFTDSDHSKLNGIASGATNVTNNNQLTNGAGYITSADGGNATTLDGIDSSQFLRSDAADSASGILTLSGGLSFGSNSKCAANISGLSDGSTITVDFTSGIHHSVTLGGNRTFGDPSNTGSAIGQSGSIFITQDGTGSRTASFHSDYKFAGGTAPTLSTAANAIDRLDYVIKGSNVVHAVVTLDVK